MLIYTGSGRQDSIIHYVLFGGGVYGVLRLNVVVLVMMHGFSS
jgi:hypothetical protein